MSTKTKGFCSHCFKNSYHIKEKQNLLRRSSYVCQECKRATLPCRVCQNFTKGGSYYDDEFCAEHNRTIQSFQELHKVKNISSLNDIIKYDSKISYELKHVKEGVGESIVFMDGFLNEKSSNQKEWEAELKLLYPNNPWYALTWKSNKLTDFISVKHLLKHGLFGLLRKAPIPLPPIVHAPLALHHVASIWKEAKKSAKQTGIHLGSLLKEIENEEIILYGHSLGCKVIYHTLNQMSQGTNSFNKSIIKEVHLLGGAENNALENWSYAQKAVTGNIYNYYSENDDILKYLYQIIEFNTPIGRTAIKLDGVINRDVSANVDGHTEYITHFSKFYK